MERVIFRTEYDPYRKGRNFLAVFPDDPAHPGRVCCIPFYFSGADYAVFDSYCEMDLGYYYSKTRIVHKNTPEAARCLEYIRARYGGEYRIMEKM